MSPLRADAQRNYDAVVSAARAAFAANGTQTSLDDIAEQAGVGNATLYRHFPTRDSLIVETLRLPLAELAAVARELGASSDPAAALREWIAHLGAALADWEGLADAVAASLVDEGSALRLACQPLQLATFKLLTRAQDASGARRDLAAEELFDLALAIAWRGGSERYVDLVLNGLLWSSAT